MKLAKQLPIGHDLHITCVKTLALFLLKYSRLNKNVSLFYFSGFLLSVYTEQNHFSYLEDFIKNQKIQNRNMIKINMYMFMMS